MYTIIHIITLPGKNSFWRLIGYLVLTLLLVSCESFLETGAPKTQLSSENVYQDDEAATAVVRGIYSEMMRGQEFLSGGHSSIPLLCGLSGDVFENRSTALDRITFYENELQTTNAMVLSAFWQPAYQYIYSANAVLEGVSDTAALSPDTCKQLEGEALFIRALSHFYLVNLFGDIPLALTTDYQENTALERSPVSRVYQQIIADLKGATERLTATDTYGERIRPNKWAAAALLARVYLYTEDWPAAEATATSVIDQASLYQLEPDLDKVFTSDSPETIWQLKPVSPGRNTWAAVTYIPQGDTAPAWVYLSPSLMSAFETGDLRKTSWTGAVTVNGKTFYYPLKYKVYEANQPLTEYNVILRLAEQYLIRAEARAMQNNIAPAIADLNALRERAGLSALAASLSQAQALEAIRDERRAELFAEGGHRWLDLKRTGRADHTLGLLKPGWQPTDVLYPIPDLEIQTNPNLTQNEGY
ncbi:RagB/SusD family nutrient uptake outer membrane protein [Sinomicrobium kalidii]|uniref:RagB/SusD family nutrient uptake outer membrane protein n=1 Tax=Sinomicrobium kalidii TaxID=2900738 RepID=UPI001E451A65|nr:RagB/SusD family nutrient uptake outer membrane protein [Sinomicrobium kalidii]UGU15397.1 RagB/SusD family nutrient uptake outer membrane protein [Sinomicrobium kalidii]